MKRVWKFDGQDHYRITIFPLGPKRSYMIVTVVWEYAKNYWVCADYSSLNGEMKNCRYNEKTAEGCIEFDDHIDDLMTELMAEIEREEN